MKVILTDPDTGKKYKIEPFDNGLCYRIFRSVSQKKGSKTRNGHTVKNDWSFTEKYPSDLPYAVQTVLQMMLNDPDGKGELDCKPDNVQKNLKKYIADMTEKVCATMIVEAMETESE